MITDVEDACFIVNKNSIVRESILNCGMKKLNGLDIDSDFMSVLSLQSTTISEFHYGILGGFHSVINMEKSSIINSRGTAVKLANPRIFKMQTCIFQKIQGIGLDIVLVATPLTLSPNEGPEQSLSYSYGKSKNVSCKIVVNSTRFIAIEGITCRA